jgi:4-hydroxythreonine-4-phosphate dehydrogenase
VTEPLPRIALTSGEPAGIGPELCLAVARRKWDAEIVCFADAGLLQERASALGLEAEFEPYEAHKPPRAGVRIAHVPLGASSRAGEPDVRNARYVLALIDRAVDGTLAGEFTALVTAPVQKSIINDAGIAFSGHTEYLAARTGAARAVMLLVAGALRVALATTHLPLRKVADAITPLLLGEVLDILDRDLKRLWHLHVPRIAVCGLNPHAGESGHLGDEEQRVIAPALAAARARGIDARGPLPADTVFVPRALANYDAVLAMFHDQGLPVLKHAGFGHAVNITLGLPLVRTSVDHGTALDLAGTGRADSSSLESAIELALEVAPRAGQPPQ